MSEPLPDRCPHAASVEATHRRPGSCQDSSSLEPIDRRAAVRHACHLESLCQPPTAPADDLWWPARVRNVSTSGIGLILHQSIAPGTVLEVEVQNAAETFSSTLAVRVVHSTAQPDGTWLLGCAFVRQLRDSDLKAFL